MEGLSAYSDSLSMGVTLKAVPQPFNFPSVPHPLGLLLALGSPRTQTRLITFIVSSNKSKDVFVAQHDRLVYLCFPEPRPFFTRRENLHSHITTPPAATPHFPKPALANNLLQNDGSSHCALDKKGQPCGPKNAKKADVENSLNFATPTLTATLERPLPHNASNPPSSTDQGQLWLPLHHG